MTTIAWRDGVMAADRLAIAGGMKSTAPKLFRMPDGGVVGGAGSYRLVMRFVAAMRRGETVRFGRGAEFGALVMAPNGRVVEYEDGETPMLVGGRFHAIGSGAQAAMAAMYCGKTAREAVAIAAKVDAYTGVGPVDYCVAPKRRGKR